MDNPILKNILPHIIALVLMMVASFVFFSPMVFDDKALFQSDNSNSRKIQKEIHSFRTEDGKQPLWTNSLLGGMPAYQVHQAPQGNYLLPAYRASILWQPMTSPHTAILLGMFCFYILMMSLQIDWKLGLIGALVYGLSSYNIDIAEAGHSTKLLAMAYAPGIFAGMILAFRGKYVLGAGILGLCLGLQLHANHVQITYYTAFLCLAMGVVYLFSAIRKGTFKNFIIASILLVVAAAIGALSNTSKIWPTYEYSKETIRGKSELLSKADKGTGLDKEYATNWSYGFIESLTTLVQNVYGGGASQNPEGTKTYQRLFTQAKQQMLQQGQSPEQAEKSARRSIASMFYWGSQPFVGVSIYFGAIIWLLFILGAFLVKGEARAWLISAAIIAFIISWGKNFIFHDLLFNYVPMFNRFRAVSMALGLAHLAFIGLGMLGLQKVFDKTISTTEKTKALYMAIGITGGICLLLLLGGGLMSYSGPNDNKIQASLLSLIKEDRVSLLRVDAFRSLVLILIAAGLIWAYLNKKIRASWAVIAIGAITFLDIWTINKRILGTDEFEDKLQLEEAEVQKSPADEIILRDKTLSYRVLDLSRGNPFLSNDASSFHKSLGGHHAARLMIYDELKERYLINPSANRHILDMLNTRYIIQDRNRPTPNPNALGNAWFVQRYNLVETADAELDALANLQPKNTAVIQKKFSPYLDGLKIQPDSTASIRLVDYHPDKLVYEYSTRSEQLAIFSEIYYTPSKGWEVYLDGEAIEPFIKADYVLRALKLPAGQKRKLEMVFKPKSFYMGENISRVASILTWLLFIGGIVLFFRQYRLPEATKIEDEPLEKINKQAPKKVKKTVAKTQAKKKKKK